VVVIALGLLALAAFAALAEAGRRGSAVAQAAAQAEAFILATLAGLGVLFALGLLARRCDESCDDTLPPGARSGEWWTSVHAWQWYAESALAAIGFAAVCAALVSLMHARHRLATGLMLLAAAAFGGWAAFLAPLGAGLGI
jgi:hypothetical protein